MFREAVLGFFGASAESKTCSPAQKARCKFEYGEFAEWTCSKCDRNPNRKQGGT